MTTVQNGSVRHPCDAAALRSIGVLTWEQGPGWPLSEVDFNLLVEAAETAYVDALRSLDRETCLIALADIGFKGTILQYVNRASAAILAQRQGAEMVSSDGLSDLTAPNAESLVSQLWSSRPRRTLPHQAAVRLAKRWLFNAASGPMARVRTTLLGSDTVLVGSMSPLVQAWLMENRRSVDVVPIESLVSISVNLCSRANDPWNRIAEAVCDAIVKSAINTLGIDLDLRSFKQAWSTRMSFLEREIMQATVRLSPNWKTIFVQEIGKPWQRVAAISGLMAGREVITAHHGYFMGEVTLKEAGLSVFSLANKVLCYNYRNAKSISISLDMSDLRKYLQVLFEPASQSNSYSVLSKNFITVFSGPIKTAMIIGYPMNSQRYIGSVANYFSYQLFCEREIARHLRARGIKVIYKAHPERLDEVRGLLDDVVDSVEGGYLQDKLDLADVFIFGTQLTTAFNIAVSSGKPLFVVEPPAPRWVPGVRDAFGEQIRLIPGYWDEVGHFRVDTNALDAAIDMGRSARPSPYMTDWLGLSGGDA